MEILLALFSSPSCYYRCNVSSGLCMLLCLHLATLVTPPLLLPPLPTPPTQVIDPSLFLPLFLSVSLPLSLSILSLSLSLSLSLCLLQRRRRRRATPPPSLVLLSLMKLWISILIRRNIISINIDQISHNLFNDNSAILIDGSLINQFKSQSVCWVVCWFRGQWLPPMPTFK